MGSTKMKKIKNMKIGPIIETKAIVLKKYSGKQYRFIRIIESDEWIGPQVFFSENFVHWSDGERDITIEDDGISKYNVIAHRALVRKEKQNE